MTRSNAASIIDRGRVDTVHVVGVSACTAHQCVMCVADTSTNTPQSTHSLIYSQVLSTRLLSEPCSVLVGQILIANLLH